MYLCYNLRVFFDVYEIKIKFTRQRPKIRFFFFFVLNSQCTANRKKKREYGLGVQTFGAMRAF